MKVFSDECRAAIAAGEAMSHGAIKIDLAGGETLAVWGGYGDLTLDDIVYTGVGDRGLVYVTGGQLGSGEQGITATLSGIDPDTDIGPLSKARGAPVTVWRLIFDLSGRTLLDATPYLQGRVDELAREETIGGEAKLIAKIEGAARGMGRHGARMRSDADQRMISGTDAGFRRTAVAADKMLYWGGAKPVRAGAATAAVVTVFNWLKTK